MADTIRVTDETTRAELVSALANVCERAKRIPHAIGTADLPTEWDRRHAQIDQLLDDLDRAPA